jgi:hypothetical protein
MSIVDPSTFGAVDSGDRSQSTTLAELVVQGFPLQFDGRVAGLTSVSEKQ